MSDRLEQATFICQCRFDKNEKSLRGSGTAVRLLLAAIAHKLTRPQNDSFISKN